MLNEDFKARLEAWPTTEIKQMLDETGLCYHLLLPRRLRFSYCQCDLDGAAKSLEGVVDGSIRVRNIGIQSRISLASALLRWYRMRLAQGE